MLKALMTRTSKSDPVDVPKTYEAMRDILIAIRYMCTKRMIFPVVTANIEQRNGFLIMNRMGFNTNPRNFADARRDLNCGINVRWLLKAFTRTADYFDLLPVIADRSGEFQPLAATQFNANDPDFAYQRQYDIRQMAMLTDISKPRLYTLTGVNYNGVQIPGQNAEEIESGERGGDQKQSAQASETWKARAGCQDD